MLDTEKNGLKRNVCESRYELLAAPVNRTIFSYKLKTHLPVLVFALRRRFTINCY